MPIESNRHFRKQLDLKLRQMDRFETIVRNAADRQRKWREQLIYKQRENEELQVSVTVSFCINIDMTSRTLATSQKTPTRPTPTKVPGANCRLEWPWPSRRRLAPGAVTYFR